LLARESNLPGWLEDLKPYRTKIFYALFVISMYLSGVPSFDTDMGVIFIFLLDFELDQLTIS